MDLQLAEHVAVVVGGANGIGRAIAAAFAAERSRVALIDRSADVEATASAIAEEFHVTVRGYECDATDQMMLQRIGQSIRKEFGLCNHLIYAAGTGSGKFGFPFWNLQPSDWPRVLDVNLMGAVNTAQVFREQLTAQPGGSVLFISSVAGQIGSQTDPPYSAAKAALINFSQCAARDLAPHDVRVNTICPGMVQTAINKSVWQAWHDQQPVESRRSYDEWASEKIQRVVPLGRWQTCEDVAALAVFLASPRAQNITGQTINVDGGQVMHW